MDLLMGLGLYIVTALSLAGTSYVTLFLPSMELLEEIIEDESPYGGVLGFIIWNICAAVAAPWTLYILIQNDNDGFIESLAVALANKILDEEDEE